MDAPPASVRRGSNHLSPAGSAAPTVGKRTNPIAKQTTQRVVLETAGRKPRIANETSSPSVATPPILLESKGILSVGHFVSISPGFVEASVGLEASVGVLLD